MALEHFEMLKAIEKQILCKFNIAYEVPIKYVIYWYLRFSISFALICAVFMAIPILPFSSNLISLTLFPSHTVDFMFFSPFCIFLHPNKKDKMLDRRPRNLIKLYHSYIEQLKFPTTMNAFLL